MKANVSKRVMKEELSKVYEQLYKMFANDLVKNTLATTAVVLMREFGFSEDDIKRLQKELEHEFELMETGALGKEYKSTDPAKFLESKGIDFNGSYL
jgi:predicted nucleic acid-binding protein